MCTCGSANVIAINGVSCMNLLMINVYALPKSATALHYRDVWPVMYLLKCLCYRVQEAVSIYVLA